jgi:Protein of unknown function (DUF3429)
MEGSRAEQDAVLARTGRVLAMLGFLPVLALALWLYAIAPDHPWRQGTIALLTRYAALSLSFLAGIRWGMALTGRAPQRPRDLMVSVLPPLIAWVALALQPRLCFAFLAVAFAAQGAWDALDLAPGSAPDWFRRARLLLTVPTVAALILAFASTG